MTLLKLLVPVCVSLVLGACSSDKLEFDNRQAFLAARKDRLEELDAELRAYRRIRDMSDGLRHFKELNGELISFEQAGADTISTEGTRRVIFIDSVLIRDSIARIDYERFRQDLIQTGFIEVMLTDRFTAFLFDGILDNVNGFIRIQPGAAPPSLNSELFGSELVVPDQVMPGWFYFATT
jgi:hypothetical protein